MKAVKTKMKSILLEEIKISIRFAYLFTNILFRLSAKFLLHLPGNLR